jgi:HAMP domain-containing protein
MKRDAGVFQRLSLRLGSAVAVVTSLVFVFTVLNVARQERDLLTRELTQRLLSKSRSLSLAASGPLLRHDPELGLHPLILRALDDTPDLIDLVVLDSQRTIQGHRDVSQIGMPREETDAREILEIERLEDESVWLQDEDLLIERPIRHLDQTIGWLIMKASRKEIEATVRRAQRDLILGGVVGTLLAIAAVSILVSVSLRPLSELRRGLQRIGSGDLAARVHVKSRNELGMLASMVNSMAEGLEKVQGNLIQKERMDHELQIAHDLQFMLLPQNVKPASGYFLETHYTPALEVSGDYYDVFALDKDHVGLAVADVSGKGVPGLVIMSMLRTMLRSLAAPQRDPFDVLVRRTGCSTKA